MAFHGYAGGKYKELKTILIWGSSVSHQSVLIVAKTVVALVLPLPISNGREGT